jgi:hypothetical protein
MMWVVLLAFLATGDARLDGRKFAIPGTGSQSQEACEAKIREIIEKRGPPPANTTLECKQVEIDQPKE